MEIEFYKYQGTGNDFIILDNRKDAYSALATGQIRDLCHRRFGIGADGLMMLNEKEGYDFEMRYFNADGREGSMCGNGGRCIVRFAADLGIHKAEYSFLATDGPHAARIDDHDIVSLRMIDVDEITEYHGDLILNTGSPHYIKYVNDLDDQDVVKKGMDIRYDRDFEEEGINVNFVERLDEPDKIAVRTYERGVEDETFSCGTGVTAAALVSYHNESGFNLVYVHTKGGDLQVEFDRVDEGSFSNIWLCGPAKKVYEGKVNIA